MDVLALIRVLETFGYPADVVLWTVRARLEADERDRDRHESDREREADDRRRLAVLAGESDPFR
jgi:hypothetical protein